MNYFSIRLYVIHNHQPCCGLKSCFLDFFQSFFSFLDLCFYLSASLVSDAVLQFIYVSSLFQLDFFLDSNNFAVTLAYFSCPMQLFCSRSRSFLSNAMVVPKNCSHINIEIGTYIDFLHSFYLEHSYLDSGPPIKFKCLSCPFWLH